MDLGCADENTGRYWSAAGLSSDYTDYCLTHVGLCRQNGKEILHVGSNFIGTHRFAKNCRILATDEPPILSGIGV